MATPCGVSASVSRQPTSTTSTSRPTRCTRTSPPTTWRGDWRARSRSWPLTSSSAPGPCSSSKTASAGACSRPGRKAVPRCANRWLARRPDAMSEGHASVSYVLPLRWAEPGPIQELSAYLRTIAGVADEILVVDGSPAPVFAEHAAALRGIARHLAPHPDLDFQMGKVNGVLTGVRECSGELIVLADDDVRYDPPTLRRAVELLGEADLVRPQNYFDEMPWHARWDTARSLLNRVFTGDPAFPVGDFPGTLAVRRSAVLATGGYDGDALFENLELMRTIRAAGGKVATPLDLYVPRRPPSTDHFLSQRVRQ